MIEVKSNDGGIFAAGDPITYLNGVGPDRDGQVTLTPGDAGYKNPNYTSASIKLFAGTNGASPNSLQLLSPQLAVNPASGLKIAAANGGVEFDIGHADTTSFGVTKFATSAEFTSKVTNSAVSPASYFANLPGVAGAKLGLVKNGGNVTVNPDGSMDANIVSEFDTTNSVKLSDDKTNAPELSLTDFSAPGSFVSMTLDAGASKEIYLKLKFPQDLSEIPMGYEIYLSVKGSSPQGSAIPVISLGNTTATSGASVIIMRGSSVQLIWNGSAWVVIGYVSEDTTM